MLKHQQVIRERKSREKDQRIQSILEAAKKVFFSKGYLKTTMDEIAFEAQISKPTIYQYFNAKEELYSSLMLPFLEEFGAQMERIEKKIVNKKHHSLDYFLTNGIRITRSIKFYLQFYAIFPVQ